MALEVWIGKVTTTQEPALIFEPVAYYWCLFPLFEEFAGIHGQMIELYDDTTFDSEALLPVLELVDKAQALISAQPAEFDVCVGTNLGTFLKPKKEKIYHQVRRDEFMAFLSAFRLVVLEAQLGGKGLVFWSD